MNGWIAEIRMQLYTINKRVLRSPFFCNDCFSVKIENSIIMNLLWFKNVDLKSIAGPHVSLGAGSKMKFRLKYIIQTNAKIKNSVIEIQ